MAEFPIIQIVLFGNCLNNKNQIILRFKNLNVIKKGLTQKGILYIY
jgi:hypothetical protein